MDLYRSVEEYYMARCLQLAAQGRGTVSPNPMVGAIVLDRQGRKVGEGYHQKAGGPHAEVVALDQAGDAARGGTLYINLEPCNHTGKTPPCTQRIIQSGVERVVCGTLDPNPLVAGSGRDALQNARISVRYGYLEEACYRLNEVFFHAITTSQPFVTVKLGLTLDGKIAARNNTSRWITGPYARHYVHHLRHQHDAVLTTAETVIQDDPLLNVRDIPGILKQPVRLVLDRRFRLNPDRYKVFENMATQPTWVFTSKVSHNRAHAQQARARGTKVFEVDETGLGLDFAEVLSLIGGQSLTSVFVEAGGRLAGTLVRQQLVNKLILMYGARVLADPMAKAAFAEGIAFNLKDAPQLQIVETRRLDRDVVMEAYPFNRPTRVKV